MNFSLKNIKPDQLVARLDEQRKRFDKQDQVAKRLNAVPTKQQLRDKGLKLALAHVRRQYPFMTRSERRELAIQMHRDGWKARDKEAVKKITGASALTLPNVRPNEAQL
jgi:hypothetical protein